MEKAHLEVLISRRRINTTVRRLAGEITRDYAAKNPLIVGILKGSFVFLADLVRRLDFPLEIDFIRVASYGQGLESSHEVTMLHTIHIPVKGRHVLLVEDIIDSGISVDFVLRSLRAEKPASLKLCSLLDKPSRREVTVPIDYSGFTVPDRFLVGYGLDYAEQYRHLPDICALEDEQT
jgi:hypoxanthine phosphoribosyltransferase